jgi:hypothetical protein
MGLGGGNSDTTWLTVGYGHIRQKCNSDHSGAVERTDKEGKKIYAIEHGFVEGALVGIRFEGEGTYGNQWVVFIRDGKEKYGLQISEKSRYATDLLKRIPKLAMNQFYKFTAYDFETKEKKRKIGLSIKDKEGNPVDGLYQDFEKTPDGKWKVTNKNGYPNFEGDSEKADTEDWQMYYMKATKVMREKALEYIQANFTAEPLEQIDNTFGQKEPDDDLPF